MNKFYQISNGVLISLFLIITPPSLGLTAQEVYQKTNKSVYTLYTVNFSTKQPAALGSAVAVTPHILVTNCHVAMTGNFLGIIHEDKFKLGTLFYHDVNRDICLIEIPGVDFTPVQFRQSANVKIGEEVYAVGNPQGLEKSISKGIISNKHGDRGGFILQTDANVSFGSSGGGLFDLNGKLIGITNGVDKFSKNIAFAIPTEWVIQVIYPKKDQEESVQKTSTSHPMETGETSDQKVLTTIGVFGKNKIGLYKYDNKCFVYFTGLNKFGETLSSALWYPGKPDVMIFFPRTYDINRALLIMNQEFQVDQMTRKSINSHNFLLLGNNIYELIGNDNFIGTFPLLVTQLQENVLDRFLHDPQFIVQYKDRGSPQGFSTIKFGLDGFNDLMSAYKKNCE